MPGVLEGKTPLEWRKELEELGLEVVVVHSRKTKSDIKPYMYKLGWTPNPQFKDQEPSPFGGYTSVTIYKDQYIMVGRGEARCRDNEAYNRKIGYHTAFGRAIKDLKQKTDNLQNLPTIGYQTAPTSIR